VKFREHEINPLIVPEYPWEGRHTYLYGSVVETEQGLRMYYQSYVDGIGFFVCLAESEDGLNWKKPLLRPLKESVPKLYPTVAVKDEVKDFYHRTENLNCMSNVVLDYHIPSVLYMPGEDYPYRLFGYTHRGYCVAFSKDGVVFEEYRGNPVIPLLKFPNRKTGKTWFSDVAPVFYDRKRKLYRAMVKTYKIDREGRTRRCVGMSTSRDFVSWTRPRTLWVPSEEEDRIARDRGYKWADFYGLCPFNYKDYYLGFLWLFLIDHEIPEGTHWGNVEVYPAFSRDCIRWERISNEPLISLRDWHSGAVFTANQPLTNSSLKVYFSGFNFPHGFFEKERLDTDAGYRAVIGVGELLV